MSKQDEFESLIKNFKLDDIDEPKQPPASSVRQKAFNYMQDEERYAHAQATPAAPRAPQPQQRQSRPVPHGYREEVAVYNRPRASSESAGKDDSFRVKIDDEQFYEPSAPATAPTRNGGRSGGSGGSGNSGGKPPRYNNDNGDDDDEHESAGGSVNRWLKAIVVLVVVLGVSIFLALFALTSASDLFGLNKPDKEIEVQLPENLSITEIATLLKDEGIITQSLTFQIYAGLKNNAENFIPGAYMLNSNMSYDEIMRDFKTGNVKRVEVTLMFYEGMTLSQIADKLEEGKVCKKKELFAYLDKGEFPFEYDFLKEVPNDELRFHQYEGYFFPDTYIFYEGMSPAEVTRKFFSNFNNKIDDDLYEQMKKMDMTLDETMTLASIIQGEAGLPEEMALVSSVFHNRLNAPQVFPNLQSDVTKAYVETDIKPYMNQTNQPMYDAYNSDAGKAVGLPIGPINNPGLDAIKAALNPKKTDYYFFVTDVEATYYYAKTDAEHEVNKAIAKQKGDVHGTDASNSTP